MSDRPAQPSDGDAGAVSDAVPPTLTDPDRAGGVGLVGGLPQRIGNYTIVREIGSGGMGRVFEAIQRSPRRTVALKVLSFHALATPEALARFEREAQLLARLNHPNVAVVYEAGTFDVSGQTLPFFAMELVPGGESITRHAKANGLPVSRRLHLLLQACEAVAHAHEHDVVHRDVKPSNLLVGRDGRVKLIDFGIARGGEHDADATAAHTRGDSVMGTLRYMSPEQLTGQAHLVDRRSDVYALGVVAYELLCERPPYVIGGSDLASAIRQIADERSPVAPPPSRVMAGLDGAVDAVVMRAMSRGRAQRYASAGELAEAVRGLMAGEVSGVTAASRADTPSRDRPAVRRTALGRGAAVTLVIALATALAMLLRPSGPLEMVGGGWFEAWAARHAAGDSAPAEFPRNVLILALTDQTELGALERSLGIAGLSGKASEKWTLRSLHAAAIPTLVDAGARAIAFDIAFEGDRPPDEGFARAVERARGDGVPVLGVQPLWGDATATARALRDAGVVFGGASGVQTPSGLWDHDVALQPPGRSEAIPSLALAAALASRAPASRWTCSIPAGGRAVDLVEHEPAPAQGTGTGTTVISRKRLAVGYVKVHPDDLPGAGIVAGATTAVATIAMPDDRTFGAAQMDYGALATLSPGELQARVGQRIVFVTDLRTAGGEKWYDYPGGRRLPASYLQAAAIHGMLSGSWVSTATAGEALAHAGLWCAAGALAAVRWSRRGRWGGVAAAAIAILAAAGAIVTSTILFAGMSFLLNPMPSAVAAAAAAVGGFAIGRSRALAPA